MSETRNLPLSMARQNRLVEASLPARDPQLGYISGDWSKLSSVVYYGGTSKRSDVIPVHRHTEGLLGCIAVLAI
jgi:hypothetical protein